VLKPKGSPRFLLEHILEKKSCPKIDCLHFWVQGRRARFGVLGLHLNFHTSTSIDTSELSVLHFSSVAAGLRTAFLAAGFGLGLAGPALAGAPSPLFFMSIILLATRLRPLAWRRCRCLLLSMALLSDFCSPPPAAFLCFTPILFFIIALAAACRWKE